MTGANATILQGDALAVLAGLPAESVHCVVTSPPYYGLRDYGTATWEGGDPECDHKVGRFTTPASDKQRSNSGSGDMQAAHICPRCGAIRIDNQIGLEATPAEYVDRLVAVFREVRRVLRLDGVCWLNIADSYASEPFAPWGIKPKDEMDIPHYLRIALRQDGWFARATNIWHKPNPMPESVTDRCTKAHEYVFLLTKSARYFYDAQAVAEPATDEEYRTVGRVRPSLDAHFVADPDKGRTRAGLSNQVGGRSTRNRRSVWTIATEPSSIDHFAKMPDTLAEICISAGTSARGVCPVCGAPWVRIVEKTDQPDASAKGSRFDQGKTGARDGGDRTQAGDRFVSEFTGWSPSCTCAASRGEAAQLLADHGVRADLPDLAPVPATVLDPFSGTGTTVRVAVNLGRNGIGIELKPAYADTSVALLGQTQPALFGL